MQKVFITGGAGFIGSRVVREFLAVNFDVTVFDSFKQYVTPDPRAKPVNLLARLADVSDDISLVTGDTLNKDFLRRTLNGTRPDVIVHMAALPLANVAIEQTEEAFDNDGDLVLRTDEIASVFRLGVGGFYMLSPGERTNIYLGGRLGFLRFNGEERRDLVNVSDGEERVYVKRNDLVFTVASGGEAYITPYLSIGGEFALDIISQGDPNVQRDPPQQNNNNVVQTGSAILPNGALFIRWFFL